MSKHAGIRRFTFNWGLATWQELYKSGCKFNYRTLRTFFNKYLKAEYTWIKEKGICQKVTLRVRHFDGTETDTAEWSHRVCF
ncbi:MAG: helix-turn-helix domain-containing protein [Cyanobacteria bacterium P01_H01_bin.150]